MPTLPQLETLTDDNGTTYELVDAAGRQETATKTSVDDSTTSSTKTWSSEKIDNDFVKRDEMLSQIDNVLGLSGANLLAPPYVDTSPKTSNQITFTVNTDGSIHVSGTQVTGTSSGFNLKDNTSDERLIGGHTYRLKATDEDNVKVYVTYVVNNVTTSKSAGLSDVDFTVDGTSEVTFVAQIVVSGDTADVDCVITPTLIDITSNLDDKQDKLTPGDAIEITNDSTINVLYDPDTLELDANGKLKVKNQSSEVEIDDSSTSTTKVWSSKKVSDELGTKQKSLTPGNGISLDSSGNITAKIDNSTIGVNANGQLEVIGGGGGTSGLTLIHTDNSLGTNAARAYRMVSYIDTLTEAQLANAVIVRTTYASDNTYTYVYKFAYGIKFSTNEHVYQFKCNVGDGSETSEQAHCIKFSTTSGNNSMKRFVYTSTITSGKNYMTYTAYDDSTNMADGSWSLYA